MIETNIHLQFSASFPRFIIGGLSIHMQALFSSRWESGNKGEDFMGQDYIVNLEEMGSRIRDIRKRQKKTQEIFADSIHISTSYLALIEQGKRSASLDIIAQLAKNCQVSVDYLLFGNPIPLESKNNEQFHTLCQKYAPTEIARALRLAEFYLELGEENP